MHNSIKKNTIFEIKSYIAFMKKLLLFTLSIAFAGLAVAQDCTPQINTGPVVPGLNPNPPAGSVAGVPYDEVNTLAIPRQVDNSITPSPGDSIPLCTIYINEVNFMPAGYNYEVWAYQTTTTTPYSVMNGPPGGDNDSIMLYQTFPITRVCIRLSNPNPPASSDMGDGILTRDTAIIQIVVGAWGDLGFGCTDLSGFGGTDTFEVHLAIKDAIYAGIDDEETNTFAVHSNYPNPADDITYLRFSTPTSDKVSINVYDAVGRNVRSVLMNSVQGVNSYGLTTADLKSGVYIYNITYNGKTVSKKLIVNR